MPFPTAASYACKECRAGEVLGAFADGPRMRLDRVTNIQLRHADSSEMNLLADIDDDAATLFATAGIDIDFPPQHEYLVYERHRWSACIAAKTALLAIDDRHGPVGFVMVSRLDGEAYVEQISVRTVAMRRGIGTSLLGAAARLAEAAGERAISLTTYAHLPWNRPFYERNGYIALPDDDFGIDIIGELAMQRRWLPHPEQRVAMRKSLRAA